MTHTDLIKYLDKALPGAGWRIVVQDSEYAVPSAASFKRAFEDDWADFMINIRRLVLARVDYSPEDFDCDDFALLAKACIVLMNVVNRRKRGARKALPAGPIYYLRNGDENQAHAIIAAVVDRAGENHLMFYEPQTGREVQLTEEEKCSIYGGLF